MIFTSMSGVTSIKLLREWEDGTKVVRVATSDGTADLTFYGKTDDLKDLPRHDGYAKFDTNGNIIADGEV